MKRTPALAVLLCAGGLGAGLWITPAGAALSDIRMGNFYFEDATIDDGQVVITAGDQLRFIVEDSGPGTPHTVEIDEFGVHSGNLAKGETYTTGPLTSPGEYALYCKLHRRRGHETTLVILPSTTTTTPSTTTPTASTTTAPSTTTTTPSTTTTTTGQSSITTSTTSMTEPTPGNNPFTTTSDESEPTSSTDANSDDERAAPPAADKTTPDPPDSDTDLAATGRGEIDLTSLEPLPPAPDSLEAILGRSPTTDGPWTRAVRSSLIALVPLTLIAAAIIARYRRTQSPA